LGVVIVGALAPGVRGQERAAAPNSNGKVLILHDFKRGPAPIPSFIRKNKAYLETLPFDGLAVYLRDENAENNVSAGAMKDVALTYETISSVLAPLKGLSFTTLAHNFAFTVVAHKPPDFFDDWSVIVKNFGHLGRAAREAGLKGILLDNENYHTWATHPDGCKYPGKTLREYQDQARLRGRQIMEAVVAEFPEAVFLCFHGPYLSEPKMPERLFPQVQVQAYNKLMGPFFVGLMEGAGKRAQVVDGGELYWLRTPEQFEGTYTWRKQTIASEGVKCAYIPPAIRATWADRLSVGFGVYDRKSGDVEMNPKVMAPTLTHALRQSDRYVWLYVEGLTFLKPGQEGGASDEWVQAVRQGRQDARPVKPQKRK
jgi:hypothetical protein